MTATLDSTGRASRAGLTPVIGVHLALFVGGGVALALDPPAQGWAVLVVVTAYVGALLWVCRAVDRPDLLALAGFLAIVSVFQVFSSFDSFGKEAK